MTSTTGGRARRAGLADLPGSPGTVGLVGILLTVVGYLALVVFALTGNPTGVLLAAVVTLVAEVVGRFAPASPWDLDRPWLPAPWRWMTSVAAVLVLAERAGGLTGRIDAWLVVSALATATTAGVLQVAATVTTHLRKSPLLSLNLPLGDLSVPPSPRRLVRYGGWLALPLHALLILSVTLDLADLLPEPAALVGVVTVTVAAVAMCSWAAACTLLVLRSTLRRTVPAAVQGALSAFAPDVVLYFGGRPEALYQVEMWLAAMERSQHRVLVLLRDREAWRLMRPTTLPVVCAPADTVLTSLDLGTVRAALYVANGSRNIHLLRMGGMRSAFIGHGDSDKASSRNPFAKVYDEIWVAGPAGARRYAAQEDRVAGAIREVGLPHADVAAASSSRADAFTVVYAPTWEGWGEDTTHSSLPWMGVELVRTLIDLPEVRVIYRPHPLTGSRDGATRRAHESVLDLLHAAGAAQPPPSPARPSIDDDLDVMRRGGTPVATVEGVDDFWERLPGTTPGIAVGELPGLSSVLDHADLLVTDVSGVLTDWIARDRPLVVTNPTGLSVDDFRAQFSSSRAGLVVGQDVTGLTDFVKALQHGDDPTGADRATVRTDLLGPPGTGGQRFEEALDRIVREA